MTETIAAVVVTYNRKQLLTECLDALFAQTRPVDKVILIDNASLDGTPEWLEERGYLANPLVDYVRLPENTGGAGGFYEGMKRGYEAKYDWLWLMDDDGVPNEVCLSTLLSSECMSQADFRCPIVVDRDNTETFSFPYVVDGVKYERIIDLKRSLKESCFCAAQPFNGILLRYSLVDKLGYPKKEMFIWGDEIEFLKRAITHGFYPMTNSDAIFFHPKDRQVWTPVLRGLLGRDLRVDGVRKYCFYRNQSYIIFRYDGVLQFCFWIIKNIIKKLFSFRFSDIPIMLRAIIDGATAKWGREKLYLNP